MNSYEFEKAAKNVVIDMLAKRGIEVKIDDLNLVWFTHLLGICRDYICAGQQDGVCGSLPEAGSSGYPRLGSEF